jgi:hypothetical protein
MAMFRQLTARLGCRITLQSESHGHSMVEDLLLKALAKAAEEGLATLDLWWARVFGRSLSGRMYKLEIQTLFHGNTRDQDQI